MSSVYAVDKLLNKAVEINADIVEGSFNVIKGSKVELNQMPDQYTEKGIDSQLKMVPYPWGKVMKLSLWENVFFPEQYWFEDTMMTFLIYPKVKVYASVSDVIYNYIINEKGITLSSKGKVKNLDTLYIVNFLLNEVKQPISPFLKNVIVFQLTRRMSRILPLDNIIQEASFVYSKQMIENNLLNYKGLKLKNWLLLKIFEDEDFYLWKLVVLLRI